MKSIITKKRCLVLPLALSLVACGGGGSSSSSSSSNSNEAVEVASPSLLTADAKSYYVGNQDATFFTDLNSANLLSDVYKHISQITNPALNPYGFPIEVKSHKSTSSDCQSGDYSMQVQQPTTGIGPATLTMNNCLMGYSDESNRVTFNGKK